MMVEQLQLKTLEEGPRIVGGAINITRSKESLQSFR